MASKMNKYMAEQILGLSGSYTAADARTAYRHAVKNNHPDCVAAAGGDVDEANAKMAEINAAYAYIENMFEDGCARVECSAQPVGAEAKPEPEPVYDMAPVPTDIIDEKAAAAARKAQMDARAAAEAAKAREAELRKDPIWYGIAAIIAEHFPYRIAMVLAAIAFMSVLSGANLIATMGFVPSGWTAPDTNPVLSIMSVLFFLAAIVNLAIPFMTHPLRQLILAALEHARRNAYAKRVAKYTAA